jgi:hypothetical protein
MSFIYRSSPGECSAMSLAGLVLTFADPQRMSVFRILCISADEPSIFIAAFSP